MVPDASTSSPSPTADREFVHARVIAASPEQVFRAIAEPERLARWWGPQGFSSSFEHFDFRPGGSWRFVFHGPDGTDYPNENVFREIVPAARVLIEHPSEQHHFFLTITLDAQDGQTRVGWRQVFDTAAHARAAAPIVREANEQNLDRLDAEVRRLP